MKQDMRFYVIREKVQVTGEYSPDGKSCSVCSQPTVVGSDVSRRHCSNDKCNALIAE